MMSKLTVKKRELGKKIIKEIIRNKKEYINKILKSPYQEQSALKTDENKDSNTLKIGL